MNGVLKRGRFTSGNANKLQLALIALLLLVSAPLWAADSRTAPNEVPYLGRIVAEVIDEFRDRGHPFAYSTSLVNGNMMVQAEPEPGSALDVITQILRPYGLVIRTDSGVHLIVRDTATSIFSSKDSSQTRDFKAVSKPMENVIVSASRYAISRDIAASKFSIDQRTIQNFPDVGEDPIRVTQRLPGAAASGGSAIAHFRGGETGEIGIMLNGQWLFDPFHIRDFQSIFSAIDARAIEGVEVYTGGFPVQYGDRMSGLVLMNSVDTEKTRHNEIGISVFNTSLLTAGEDGNKRWLLSARRGNLDLIIDPKYGQPSYFDVFGEFAFEITPRTRLSINALYAEDAVDLILETEPTERDQVSSETRNAQVWVRLDGRWSDYLTSTTVLSSVDYTNRRNGYANDMEKMVAAVQDDRDTQQLGFRQDWLWKPTQKHWMQWGITAKTGKSRYRYDGTAQYFGLQALYKDKPLAVIRSVEANPKGGSYAFYISDRWQLTERSIVEWGLRWDDQTYTDLSSDSQLSPRLSYLHNVGDKTELRISVGRYFQSQPIHSLQVEDGITNFWPAQRADHIILGMRHLFENDTSLRVELFYKDIGKVRPRFENLFDPLGLMPELQQDRVRLDPASASARGIELSVDRALGNFGWWASYTGSSVTDEINGAAVQRSWDQRHSLQAGVDWKKDKWNLSAATSVHSGWPTTDLQLTDDGAVIPGPRNENQHELYASLDIRVSRTFDVRYGSLMAFVEISNVLNRRNVCCLDWDIIENAAGEDTLERGQDYWMPMLPAIGFLWEF